jgi:hypothetical protein
VRLGDHGGDTIEVGDDTDHKQTWKRSDIPSRSSTDESVRAYENDLIESILRLK